MMRARSHLSAATRERGLGALALAAALVACSAGSKGASDTAEGPCPPPPFCRDQPFDGAGVGVFAVDQVSGYREIEPLGDVNGDGFADLSYAGFVIFGEPSPGALHDDPVALAGRGFSIPSLTDPGLRLVPFPAGDVNGDGLDDILVQCPEIDTVWLVHGKGDLAPVDLALVAAGEGGFVITGVGYVRSWNRIDRPGVDFDGDGLDDLFLGGGTITRGQADGAPVDFMTATPLATSDLGVVTVADLDADGIIDIAGCDGSQQLAVLRAPDGWAAPARVTTPIDGIWCGWLEAGDLDGDGVDDLVINYYESDYGFTRILHGPVALDGEAIALNPDCNLRDPRRDFADVDGDGDFETLAAVTHDGVHLVLEAEAVESYAPKPATVGGCGASPCPPAPAAIIDVSIGDYSKWVRALGDVDGDGRDDVYFANADAVITHVCDIPR